MSQGLSRAWNSDSWPLVSILIIAALLFIFGLIAEEVAEGEALGFDRAVLLALRDAADPSRPIGPPWLLEAARDVTSLGSTVVIGLILIAVVGYFLLDRERATAWLMLGAVVGGVALNDFLKFLFARPRPVFVAPAVRVFTSSFPSGHAALSAITYLTFGAILARTHASARIRRLVRRHRVGDGMLGADGLAPAPGRNRAAQSNLNAPFGAKARCCPSEPGRQQHDLRIFKGGTAEISARRRWLLVATDGEVKTMRSPLQYRIRPSELRALAPGPSLTRQAIQLGWFPGVRIQQTSAEEYGQIYVPFVNWTMMFLTLALIVGFGSSDRLAGAYGTAVSTTMLLTTALLYKVMRDRWRWLLANAVAVSGAFLVVDFAFFSANLLKIGQGGWIPLALGSLIFAIMTTWRFGIDALHREVARAAQSPDAFFRQLRAKKIPRPPGTAIFLTRLDHAIPPLIVAYVAQIGAIHQTVAALTVKFEAIPRVPRENRLEATGLSEDFWHLTVRYGFVEIPDLPAALRLAKSFGAPIDPDNVVYFGAADEVVRSTKRAKLARWRFPLFAFMFRNSVHAVDLFKIPSQNFVDRPPHRDLTGLASRA